MSTRTLKARIQLRRDTEVNYDKVKDTFVPLKGEVLIVDTTSDGLRSKVGDGVKTFAQLSYSDQTLVDLATSIVVKGYYYNGQFYSDQAHTIVIAPFAYKIYINLSDYTLYAYENAAYHKLVDIPTATSTVAGITKVYNATGSNTDGTMTQSSITTEIAKKISASYNETDEELVFTAGV